MVFALSAKTLKLIFLMCRIAQYWLNWRKAMSNTDIKMSDVFNLPINIGKWVLSRLRDDEIKAVSHAINSHDALVEQNKALKAALEGLCCSPFTRLTKHVLLEVSEADIDAAIKALEQDK
jgi:hypothetical protein